MILYRKGRIDFNDMNVNPDLPVENFMANLKDMIKLGQVYEGAMKEISTKLEILDEEFNVMFSHNPIHHMECRIKQPKSIMNKLRKDGLELNLESAKKNLKDIAGIRVICYYVEDIYTIAELLLRQDDVELVERKDYLKNPKPSGYRSLHLVVKIPVFLAEGTINVPVEVQIRTIGMDFWASLEHKLKYKNKKEVEDDLLDELVDCAKTISEIDEKMESIYNRIKKYDDLEGN